MGERVLNLGQKEALKKIGPLLVDPELDGNMIITSQDLQEVYNLYHHDALTVMAVLGLVFAKMEGVTISPKHKRRLSSIIVNAPPGERQIWEERCGVQHIPKGRYPTGRNRSGRLQGHR